jgi:uncharacterized protein (DUF488 family)
MARVYTIGHSNGPVERFIERLEQHRIVVVVDVRSKPHSRYNPQYNRGALAESLRVTGRPYVFSGHALGGLPDDDLVRGSDGRPDYDKIRAAAEYQKEIDSIARGVEDGRFGPLAIMCAEADPTKCHRRRLVGVDFVARGLELVHIMGDGSLQTEHEIREREGENQPSVLDLFGG